MSAQSSKRLFGLWTRPSNSSSGDNNETSPPIDREATNDEQSVDLGIHLKKKEDRRAQVRRAQIEHRERKKNLVKYLEQDVITWRQKVATVTQETASIEIENDNLRAVLSSYKVSTSTIAQNYQSRPSGLHLGNVNALRPQKYAPSNPQHLTSMTISINFDESLNLSYLQVQELDPASLHLDSGLTSPDMFNIPTHNFGRSPASTSSGSHATVPSFIHEEDFRAQIALNFILCLEHPCRTHFHPPGDFDISAPPSGHEIMASTIMYACAPSYVFPHAPKGTGVTWDFPPLSSPAKELDKLRDLSDRLPKEDIELTPVQAWFFLLERYGIAFLFGENGKEGGLLEEMKKELSLLVKCFAFGAVMSKEDFLDVVTNIVNTAAPRVGFI